MLLFHRCNTLCSFSAAHTSCVPRPSQCVVMLNAALVFVFYSRVCGRKRKGTPVKVCDRVYVTEDEEEESMSEHSYSPGIYIYIYTQKQTLIQTHTHTTHILPHAVNVFIHSGSDGKQVCCVVIKDVLIPFSPLPYPIPIPGIPILVHLEKITSIAKLLTFLPALADDTKPEITSSSCCSEKQILPLAVRHNCCFAAAKKK